MSTRTRPASGATSLAEMREFASFSKGTQRYIRRSLDVGLARRDAVKRWSRDPAEAAGIRAQERIYRRLDPIRSAIPDAEVTIRDLAGDGDHYAARVVSASFAGLSRVRQHQKVYAALGGRMGGELHALQLETAVPQGE